MADYRRDAGLEQFLAERGAHLLRTAMLLTGSKEAGEDLLQAALERLLLLLPPGQRAAIVLPPSGPGPPGPPREAAAAHDPCGGRGGHRRGGSRRRGRDHRGRGSASGRRDLHHRVRCRARRIRPRHGRHSGRHRPPAYPRRLPQRVVLRSPRHARGNGCSGALAEGIPARRPPSMLLCLARRILDSLADLALELLKHLDTAAFGSLPRDARRARRGPYRAARCG